MTPSIENLKELFELLPPDIREKLQKFLAKIDRSLRYLLTIPEPFRSMLALGMLRSAVDLFNETPFDTVQIRFVLMSLAIEKLELDPDWPQGHAWCNRAAAL